MRACQAARAHVCVYVSHATGSRHCLRLLVIAIMQLGSGLHTLHCHRCFPKAGPPPPPERVMAHAQFTLAFQWRQFVEKMLMARQLANKCGVTEWRNAAVAAKLLRCRTVLEDGSTPMTFQDPVRPVERLHLDYVASCHWLVMKMPSITPMVSHSHATSNATNPSTSSFEMLPCHMPKPKPPPPPPSQPYPRPPPLPPPPPSELMLHTV